MRTTSRLWSFTASWKPKTTTKVQALSANPKTSCSNNESELTILTNSGQKLSLWTPRNCHNFPNLKLTTKIHSWAKVSKGPPKDLQTLSSVPNPSLLPPASPLWHPKPKLKFWPMSFNLLERKKYLMKIHNWWRRRLWICRILRYRNRGYRLRLTSFERWKLGNRTRSISKKAKLRLKVTLHITSKQFWKSKSQLIFKTKNGRNRVYLWKRWNIKSYRRILTTSIIERNFSKNSETAISSSKKSLTRQKAPFSKNPLVALSVSPEFQITYKPKIRKNCLNWTKSIRNSKPVAARIRHQIWNGKSDFWVAKLIRFRALIGRLHHKWKANKICITSCW